MKPKPKPQEFPQSIHWDKPMRQRLILAALVFGEISDQEAMALTGWSQQTLASKSDKYANAIANEPDDSEELVMTQAEAHGANTAAERFAAVVEDLDNEDICRVSIGLAVNRIEDAIANEATACGCEHCDRVIDALCVESDDEVSVIMNDEIAVADEMSSAGEMVH